jgi:hypothetical protein
MAGNGHVSQHIPPTITRIITADIIDGTNARLVWIANSDLPGNPAVKIAKMIFRFDADENPDAIEVYGVGLLENRTIGVRTTVHMRDVKCVDEVMDLATWTKEIKDAEGEEEEETGEAPRVSRAAETKVVEVKPAEAATALPSVPNPIS